MPLPPPTGTIGLALLILTLPVRADVVTLNPVADTALFEFTEDYNLGAQYDLPAGGLGGQASTLRLARVVCQYDIAANIPAGASITAAQMKLHLTRAPTTFPRPSTFALYRTLVDWEEGVQVGEQPGGAPAVAGETTWNYRFHPTVAWSVPGGALGVDFSNEESASNENVNLEGDYLFDFNAKGLADLQSMLDDPTTNHGWMLKSLSEHLTKTARRWSSREAGMVPLPAIPEPLPELQVTWNFFLPIPVITSIDYDSVLELITLQVDVLPGYNYQLQTAPSPAGPWSPASLPTSPITHELVFTFSRDGARRFARVQTSPLP